MKQSINESIQNKSHKARERNLLVHNGRKMPCTLE